MTTLFDKIRYDHKLYSELTDTTSRQEIEELVAKLKPLESEIVNDQNGTITIMESGNVFTDSFDPDLAKKITNLVTGRG